MRILLIAPASEKTRVLPGEKPRGEKVFRFSMLGLLSVAACTPPEHEVRIVDESVEPIDFDADVDVVGVGFMTAFAGRAYEIGNRFRRRGRTVVFGGYHPTFRTREVLAHCDAVVVGEAENTWPDVIADIEAGRLGQVYRADAPPDLAKLRRPQRQLLDAGGYITVNAVQASRGCPHTCAFCSVSRFFNSRQRFRPVAHVVDEVAAIKDRFIMFVDDNIVGDPAYARELFTQLAPLNKKWMSQASLTIAEDDELVKLAARSGCIGLFVGIESINSAALGEADKLFNRVQQYHDSIARLHDAGIGVESGIVFGFDQDDVHVFERTMQFIDDVRLDAIQASILTPLPGTTLHDRLRAEGRIFDYDWAHYDFRHAVFHPRQMSAEQLQNGADWVISHFYSMPQVARRVLRGAPKLGWYSTLFMSMPINLAYWHRVRKWGIGGRHPSQFEQPPQPAVVPGAIPGAAVA